MAETLKTIQKRAFAEIEELRSSARFGVEAHFNVFAAEAINIIERQFAAAEALFLSSAADSTQTRVGSAPPGVGSTTAARKEPLYPAPHGTIRAIINNGPGTLWVSYRWCLLEGQDVRLFYCTRHGWQEANEHDGCVVCAGEKVCAVCNAEDPTGMVAGGCSDCLPTKQPETTTKGERVCARCNKADCPAGRSEVPLDHCAYCWRLVTVDDLSGECGQWCTTCVELDKEKALRRLDPPKEHGGIHREWYSILYEMLSYAYDNDRAATFDYDFWRECCEFVFSHKRAPWSWDGVRAQELLERIKAYTANDRQKTLTRKQRSTTTTSGETTTYTQGKCQRCGEHRGDILPGGRCVPCVTTLWTATVEQSKAQAAEAKLKCKACNTEIYIGNCCGEACTKEWLAEIKQAYSDLSDGRRFCRKCGAAHEFKSNFCGKCEA